jgi:hypothetical protein
MSETFRYYARAYQRPQRLEEKPKEVSEEGTKKSPAEPALSV